MPSPEPLFLAGDLSGVLHREVSAADAASAEQRVWGWLRPALGLTERPSPVPPEVFSWAIELGVIAHENPAGMSDAQLGSLKISSPAGRLAEILDLAGASSVARRPQGSFPPARAYPDPAYPAPSLYW